MQIKKYLKSFYNVKEKKEVQKQVYQITFRGLTTYGESFKEAWQMFILTAVKHKLLKVK